jgi:hypothetical protein
MAQELQVVDAGAPALGHRPRVVHLKEALQRVGRRLREDLTAAAERVAADVALVVLPVAQGLDGGLGHMRAAPVEVLVDAPLHEARQLLASVGEVEPGAALEGLGHLIEHGRDRGAPAGS